MEPVNHVVVRQVLRSSIGRRGTKVSGLLQLGDQMSPMDAGP
jgi:hypothetical protein